MFKFRTNTAPTALRRWARHPSVIGRRVVAAAALGAWLFAFSPATAQTICATHEQMTRFLAEEIGEELVARGLIGPEAVVEFYAARTGSWSVLITDPSGRSCILLTGEGWEARSRSIEHSA